MDATAPRGDGQGETLPDSAIANFHDVFYSDGTEPYGRITRDQYVTLIRQKLNEVDTVDDGNAPPARTSREPDGLKPTNLMVVNSYDIKNDQHIPWHTDATDDNGAGSSTPGSGGKPAPRSGKGT